MTPESERSFAADLTESYFISFSSFISGLWDVPILVWSLPLSGG